MVSGSPWEYVRRSLDARQLREEQHGRRAEQALTLAGLGVVKRRDSVLEVYCCPCEAQHFILAPTRQQGEPNRGDGERVGGNRLIDRLRPVLRGPARLAWAPTPRRRRQSLA